MEDKIDQIASELWNDTEPEWAEPTAVYDGEDRNATDGTTASHLAFDQSDLVNPLVKDMGPDFVDNGQNSFEQSVALKRWVDHAIDMLNRGEMRDTILADLAHDGCPDPDNVLRRAEEQPPVEPEQDRKEPSAPMPAVEESDATMNPTSVQSSADPSNERMQQIADAVVSPVSEISDFIASFPDYDASNPEEIRDRYANIRKARMMCANLVVKGHYDAAALDSRLKHEQEQLMDKLQRLAEQAHEAYRAPVTSRQFEVFHQADFGRGAGFLDDAYESIQHEASNLDVSHELGEVIPIMMVEGHSADYIRDYANQKFAFLSDEARTAAMAAVEAIVMVDEQPTTRTASAPVDLDTDGPAYELFL